MSKLTKEVQMAIKMEEALRDQFHKAAKANHQPAAQIIRELMREYCAKNAQKTQPATQAGSL